MGGGAHAKHARESGRQAGSLRVGRWVRGCRVGARRVAKWASISRQSLDPQSPTTCPLHPPLCIRNSEPTPLILPVWSRCVPSFWPRCAPCSHVRWWRILVDWRRGAGAFLTDSEHAWFAAHRWVLCGAGAKDTSASQCACKCLLACKSCGPAWPPVVPIPRQCVAPAVTQPHFPVACCP